MIGGSGGHSVAVPGSADPVFPGNASRCNPEELLLGALASCHMFRPPDLGEIKLIRF
jgi:organic hydroperoxide reductase OsmC/OhrA